MHKEFLMGNEAIALGALAAGVNLVAGYPGTPSTEVLETVAKRKTGATYVEWSVNEKQAMEVAAGASYAGARTMVTMKQVGLNVAADPLMSLEYVGVKGGMVVLVADDPGPISSQTEQDTRTFAMFSKLPCFDPSTAAEAYRMVQDAFELSEELKTPVFLRPTTRVCHGYASVEVKDESEYKENRPEGFIKDSKRWVIFPKLSYKAHIDIEERNAKLADTFSDYELNRISPAGEGMPENIGIAASGISAAYVSEALKKTGAVKFFKVSTPHPFPDRLAKEFLTGLDKVLVCEELDPYVERELVRVCGKYGIKVEITGKLTRDMAVSGENTRDSVFSAVCRLLGKENMAADIRSIDDAPVLPVRPPVLCAGCPHRASFYAVKQAMKGRKTIFCGDIGCYTLGNAMPLDMVDTCLCMGAGLGIAQGVWHTEPDTSCFAFVGDSTFFASAIPGVVNAMYNQASFTLVILDNSTTAMTGHQPHPGTGRNMMGHTVEKVSIEKVLEGMGVNRVETVDPLDLDRAVETVRSCAEGKGVRAIVFRSPCVALTRPTGKCTVDSDRCVGCRKCVREIGCPALITDGGKIRIDPGLCTGCGLCGQICPAGAIGGVAHE